MEESHFDQITKLHERIHLQITRIKCGHYTPIEIG